MTALTTTTARATLDDWTRFMRPVAVAVRNPPAETDFKARVAAIAHAVQVPAEWLREPWRQSEAMRRFQFWPAVFDVAEMFDADLREHRARQDLHQRLAPPEPQPVARIITQEEAAAVRAKAAAFAAEMQDNAMRKAPPARALPLSDGALLARYETLAAEGNRAAATRAEMLRKRMETQP